MTPVPEFPLKTALKLKPLLYPRLSCIARLATINALLALLSEGAALYKVLKHNELEAMIENIVTILS